MLFNHIPGQASSNKPSFSVALVGVVIVMNSNMQQCKYLIRNLVSKKCLLCNENLVLQYSFDLLLVE